MLNKLVYLNINDENMSKELREYAIVDIETTGGSAERSKITEVAIAIHNGVEVIERWESLINPQQLIPTAIFSLTGITDEMVSDAPLFSEVANTIYALLKDRIFVAHNVNFDYSFIKHQLSESEIQWQAPKLCTVRLARKIKPGLPSYSLGRLCDALHICVQHRHRAGGDVAATVALFDLLLAADSEAVFLQMLRKNGAAQRLPANLSQNTFDNLPLSAGVYYFHDRSGRVIYVGKAINIKKRVAGHFTGHNIQAKRQGFLQEIYDISYELCGTELMALLLECLEINRLWPKYNRALKRVEPKYGLVSYMGMDGYEHLSLTKLIKHQPSIQSFYSLREGVAVLRKMISDGGLDNRFCHFPLEVRLPHTPDLRLRRLQDLPDQELYNLQVAEAVASAVTDTSSYLIVDRGRHEEEKSCIWIEKGKFYAMGYIPKESQSNSWEDYKNELQRHRGNEYMMQLIESFLAKSTSKHQIILVDDQYLDETASIKPVTLRMRFV
ncbi:exonuclease domain-containing protein [Sphingobacterium sp. lm-10]|uniref:exonuclease domain-containing protein n=1 Tax=Sphingobacterium sp. lm-10 TaxID=2944904 RepID=UPI00201FC898|nr:exonuclease domain-containing protein [Sphingobacterium sp. lm-10]MCL7986955.1 exonuclease domain-containing protein [Sphingobacterium sp. lm-10]